MIGRQTLAKGGRAFGRALFLIIGAVGLGTMAQAAWIPVKAQVAQVLLNHAFDQSLAAHRGIKPWAWADTTPVARVSVARLGVSDVVLSGGTGQALAFGPTMLRGSHDVTVLAAHRDTHFAYIQDLRAGDVVLVEAIDGSRARYRVTGFQTVRWDRFAVPSDPARPLLALATCWPFGATTRGPWRRVIWAEAI